MSWTRKILRVDLSEGHLHARAAQDGMGPRLPRPARPRHQVLHRGGRPQGRSPLPRQQDHLRHGPPHGHHGLHGRALLRRHERAAHGRHRLLQLGRLLRRGTQVRRVGHDHRGGQVGQARPAAHRGRQGRAPRRLRRLGQVDLGHRGPAQDALPGPAGPRLEHRPAGRDGLPVRRRRERPAPRRRAARGGHRDGLEEPQGDRGARHEGRGQHQGPGGVHEGRQRREEGPRGQRRDGPGAPQVRHAGADERDQRDRGAAHAQPPRRAVRGREGHLGGGDARPAQDRRQGEPRHQPGLLRLHHRLRAHLEDRRDALHGGEQAPVLGRLGRARVRGGLGAGRGQWRERPGGAHLRELPRERGRLGPDHLRRHGGRGDGALRDGRPQEGAARHRGAVRLRQGPHLLRRAGGQGSRVRQGDRDGLEAPDREVRPPRPLDDREGPGVSGLRLARHPGHGARLRHVQPRRLPPARLHGGERSAGHPGEDRSRW